MTENNQLVSGSGCGGPPSAAPVTLVACLSPQSCLELPQPIVRLRATRGQQASPGDARAWVGPAGVRWPHCSLAGTRPFLRIWSLVPENGTVGGFQFLGRESQRQTPPPPPLSAHSPRPARVGPQAGVHGAWGTHKLGASPHTGPFPQTLPQARPLSRAAVLQLLPCPGVLSKPYWWGGER